MFFKISNYDEKKIIKISCLSDSDLDHIHLYDEIIVLSVQDLGYDLEIVSCLLEKCIQYKIIVRSILDKLVLHANKCFLSRYEKTLFLGEFKRSQISSHYVNPDLDPQKTLDNKKTKVKKRIGIYCRVSTREQAIFGYSIENQKEKNRMYMELFDYEVEHVEYYEDKGASAGSLRRKELQRMIDDVNADKLDEIIVYKLDRLTRNVIDVYSLLQLFLSKDVNLVAVMDNLDIQTANGRMLMGILAIIAQWERETVIERTNDGLLQMAFEGKYPNGNKAPFGYTKDKDMFLHINEQEAIAYNYIIDLACAGYPSTEISIKLLEDYKYDIYPERITRMIRNSGYYGEFVYKDIVFPKIMPALVSKEKALLAKEMIGKKNYGSEQPYFHYKRKIHCFKCNRLAGEYPTYKSKKHYYYYYCPNCNKRVNQDLITEQVLYEILTHMTKKDAEKLNIKIRHKVNTLQNKVRQATARYSEGVLDDDVYTLMIGELNSKIKDAKNELISSCKTSGHSWQELSDSEKRNIINRVVSSIIVDLEKKHVVKINYMSSEKKALK